MLQTTFKITAVALLTIFALPAFAQNSFEEYEKDQSPEYILNYDTTAAGRWIRVRHPQPAQQQQEDWLAGPTKFFEDTGKAVGEGLGRTWETVQAPFAARETLDEERYEEKPRYILNYNTTAAGRWIRWRAP